MTLDDHDDSHRRPILPGNPYADILKDEGYNETYAKMLALIERQKEDNDAERREGLTPEKSDRDLSDDEDAEIDKSGFSPPLIKAAIGEAVSFFTNDSKVFQGESSGTIHNAAVVSVGLGVILAPHLLPPGTDPVEALRLGKLQGQQAVDSVAKENEVFLKGLRHGHIDAKDEEELYMSVNEGGKISDADKKRLEAFLKKNGVAVVVVAPGNSCADSFTGLWFFKSIKKAEQYALSLLRMAGCEATPKPKGGKNDEHSSPAVNTPAPPTS